MQQLISFIQKYKYLLFFIILQTIAIHLTVSNHSFHKSTFLNSTNFISGSLYEKTSNIASYFKLKEQNELLVLENIKLKNKIAVFNSIEEPSIEVMKTDSIHYKQKYSYSTAKIIKNEFNKSNNILLIDQGTEAGITKEMAVFNSKGIIGITEKTNNNFTRVQSILNTNSGISARLKNGSNYFGSLNWDGNDYSTVQLTDIPRQANVKIGDTIVTSGRSTIFPEGLLVGTVEKVGNDNSTDNKISVHLFNDMRNLRHVYIVKSLHKLEIKTLENE
jgi:rod shape-determining protein MreC